VGIVGVAREMIRQDAIPDRLLPHYTKLLRSGTVVWGHTAQANTRLYNPGPDDPPANTLYSPDVYFDRSPHHLDDIARALYDLKGTTPRDPELARVAAIMTDEYNCVEKEPLPAQLTEGHDVYLTSTLIHRSRLPDRVLSDRLFPLLVCPGETPANMILPLPYWPEELVEAWGSPGFPHPRRGTGGA
jgi:hypothetical protein